MQPFQVGLSGVVSSELHSARKAATQMDMANRKPLGETSWVMQNSAVSKNPTSHEWLPRFQRGRDVLTHFKHFCLDRHVNKIDVDIHVYSHKSLHAETNILCQKIRKYTQHGDN